MSALPIDQIIQGDCLDIMPTLPDDSVDIVLTDPPYCSGSRSMTGARGFISKTRLDDRGWFLGDNMGPDTYVWWMREVAKECGRLARYGSHAYVFCDWRNYSLVVTAWETKLWTLRGVIVWDKGRFASMGGFDLWRPNHEWIIFFAKGKPVPLKNRAAYNTWSGHSVTNRQHPTEKPLDLLVYILDPVPGDVILDPFLGSGTTAVAAKKLGRHFLGIEIKPEYCRIAEERLRPYMNQAVLVK